MSEFIFRFGVPRELHCDEGTNFESRVFVEIFKVLDIEKCRITPLHSKSDGQVERFNRTLVEMLRGKIKKDQKDWDLQLTACMMAYRGDVPLDAITRAPPDAAQLKMDYGPAVQKRLASAHDLARHLYNSAMRQKRNYERRLAGRPLILLLLILFGCTMFGEKRDKFQSLLKTYSQVRLMRERELYFNGEKRG